MLLYINACVRTESRTRVIADALVSKYSEPVTEVVLEKIDFPKVDDAFIRRRDDLKAGGDFCPEEYGFGYVKALARNFYGIQDVRLVKATGLDIVGADADRIVEDTVAGL
ncbi:MAG: hypothetical protein K6F54_00690 [Lachnospiraceae bacterium]|nr:hypothetical protein [Lachnospiraceae bacterium]